MRKVFCQRLKQELEGLESPPFAGELGDKIYNSISKKAWQEWLDYQVMIINEYRLQLFDSKSQEFLNKSMNDYLFKGIDTKVNQT